MTPGKIFGVASVAFGLLFAMLTPPMQAPDEPNHLYRIWQLSSLHLTAAHYTALVPAGMAQMGESCKLKHLRRSVPETFHRNIAAFGRSLRGDSLIAKAIPNTSVYSPLSYAPQLAAMVLGRALDRSPLWMMYAGRIASVLCYTALGLYAIRIIPALKWAACIILASPMALFEAGSLSADGMTIGIAAVSIALALKITIGKQRTWEPWLLALSLVGLTLAKAAYVPVALLVLCIPRERWGKLGLFAPLGILLACAAAALSWSSLVQPMGTQMNAGALPRAQAAFIETHPFQFPAVLTHTFATHAAILLQSFVGDFGWLDVPLPMPFVIGYLAILALVASTDAVVIPRNVRLIGVASALACVGLIGLSDYLFFTAPASTEIEGLQGRYFIPIALLVLLPIQRQRAAVFGPGSLALFVSGYLFASVFITAVFFYRF